MLGVGNPDVEISQADKLLQIGPTQQRALHKIELAGRIGIRSQALQQRRQQWIRIEIDPRRGLVFRRHERDADPSGGADEPSRGDAQPFMAPYCVQERYGLWR